MSAGPSRPGARSGSPFEEAFGFRRAVAVGGRVVVSVYIVDPRDAAAVGRAHLRAFGEARPAATMVVVAGLLDPRWRVEIEAKAEIRRPGAGAPPG
ncbi:MAG: Endoribonuclease [Chloroflexi bacterium]|jgi:enamine deaminase RidA (YjgF/YER057c/UK114 family)|nr:Endoribonuclease [Chloroflexota bacterium]